MHIITESERYKGKPLIEFQLEDTGIGMETNLLKT